MQKLDPALYKTMPWKNGGGVTTEALVLPAAASFETFQLRVSMARVESDGPFSKLPGVDRTLVVTDGQGLALAREDGSSVTLEVGCPPFVFSGDEAIHATLRNGPVVDLNVMTRRSHSSHVARRVTLASSDMSLRPLELWGDLSVVVVLSGEARLETAATELSVDTGDIVTHASREGPVSARGNHGTAAHLLVVDLSLKPAPPR